MLVRKDHLYTVIKLRTLVAYVMVFQPHRIRIKGWWGILGLKTHTNTGGPLELSSALNRKVCILQDWRFYKEEGKFQLD